MGIKIFELFLGLVLLGLSFLPGFTFLAGPAGALILDSLFHLHLKLTGQTPANTQNTIPVVYGKGKVGATEIDWRQDSGEDGYFVGAFCHGSQNGSGIQEFHEMFIDGILWVLDGSRDTRINGGLIGRGLVATPEIADFFEHDAWYARYKGAAGQAVSKPLNDAFPTEWPVTSQLQGVAYVVGKFEHGGLEDGVFAGFPQVSAVVSGVEVYDTRTGTWAWSDNPALCIYDHLTSRIYGAGIPATRINTSSFDDAADECEETVTHPDGTRDRYTCNGVIDTALPLSRRFEMLLSSCNGALIYEGGQFRLVIRQSQAAESFTADADMIVGNFQWRKPGIKDTGNQMLTTFVSEANEFSLDTVQWPEEGSATLLTYLSEDDNRQAVISLDLPFTTNQYTALDISSIRLKELRNGDVFSFRMREQAIKYHVGDRITLDQGLLGADAPLDVWIVAMKPAADQNGQVQVDCMEYHDAAYTLPTHTAIAVPVAADPPDRTKGFAISGLSVTSIFSCASPAVSNVTLQATWTEPSGPLLRYIVQYRVQGSGTWIQAPSVLPGTGQADIVLGSVDGQTYEVGVTAQSVNRVRGTQATATVDLASVGRSAPDGSAITAPDITVTQVGGQVRLDVDTTGSNGTIVDWNASASSGFTPGPANLLDRAFTTTGATVSLFATPPGSAGDTVYYKIGVRDCLSDSISEATSYSGEFSFVYSGATAGGQQIGQVDHGTKTGTYDIDWAAGTFHTITVGASALTITYSGYAAGMAITLRVTGGAGALTLPATNYSPGGTTPTGPGSGEVDLYGYLANAGATLADIDGHKIGDDYS